MTFFLYIYNARSFNCKDMPGEDFSPEACGCIFTFVTYGLAIIWLPGFFIKKRQIMKKNNQQPVPADIVETPATPHITELIVLAVCQQYEPDGNADALELKSSIDLMNEVSAIADIEKWEIATALKEAGFKLKYTDAGMYWKLYKI